MLFSGRLLCYNLSWEAGKPYIDNWWFQAFPLESREKNVNLKTGGNILEVVNSEQSAFDDLLCSADTGYNFINTEKLPFSSTTQSQLFLEYFLSSCFLRHQLISCCEKPTKKKKSLRKCKALLLLTRCSLVVVVSDARWSCVAHRVVMVKPPVSSVSASEIPAVIVLPGFQGSEENHQLIRVVPCLEFFFQVWGAGEGCFWDICKSLYFGFFKLVSACTLPRENTGWNLCVAALPGFMKTVVRHRIRVCRRRVLFWHISLPDK